MAKYNFKAQGKTFSLLKLYSVAQAFDGNRIAGSIYGVALLSENDLPFSQKNIELLNAAKDAFTQLSLNGLKFNKSNFFEDAYKIWELFKEQRYFNIISHNGLPKVSFNSIPIAFGVESLYKDSLGLNSVIEKTNKVYVSEDLEHLKRTQQKWGNKFPVYSKQNGEYRPHKEEIILPPSSPSKSKEEQIRDLEMQLSKKRNENYELQETLSEVTRKLKKRTINFICSTAACLLLAVVFFLQTKWWSIEIPVSPDGNIKALRGQIDNLTQQLSEAKNEIKSLVDVRNVSASTPSIVERDSEIENIEISFKNNISINTRTNGTIVENMNFMPRLPANVNKNEIQWEFTPNIVGLNDLKKIEVTASPSDDTKVTVSAIYKGKKFKGSPTLTVQKKVNQ